MKKSFLLPLLILPILAYSQAKTASELNESGFKKYEARSGKIVYKVSGSADGDEVMIFDKYGWSGMRKQTMIFELYGIKTIQTLHEITDGDFVYRLNEGDSTYSSRQDYKWSQQAAYKTPVESSEAILLSLGGKYVSDSTLLDKRCQVWTFDGKALQELWIWNGLALKRKTKLGDRIIFSTAKSIEMDIEVEPIIFSIPSFMNEKN